MKQLRRLTQLLIISGSLNVAQALYFVWMMKDKPIITSLKPVKLREQLPSLADHRSTSDVILEFKSMPLEQLLAKLHNNHLVENGLLQSDLALACLVSFHHFDLERALSGQVKTIQKYDISLDSSNPLKKITVYPGLTVDQYQSILAFSQKEKWPLTAEGIFIKWQGEADKEKDRTLEEAFYLTHEFLAVETLFRRTDAAVDKKELFQMIMQGDWQTLKQLMEQQKLSQDISSARRQKLLVDYIGKGSKTAASILIKTDEMFASKRLDDSAILAVLKLLDENTKEVKVFLTHLLASPRCDSIRQLASATFQKLTGEAINYEVPQQKSLLTKFTPGKVEEKKNSVRPPLAYQPPASSKPAAAQPPKVRTHVVQEGDSLWKISRRYKTSVEVIMKQNNLKSDLLKPGTTLKIP